MSQVVELKLRTLLLAQLYYMCITVFYILLFGTIKVLGYTQTFLNYSIVKQKPRLREIPYYYLKVKARMFFIYM